jgi:hypothetical protein
MLTIFKRLILISFISPLVLFAYDQPCGFKGYEKTNRGWMRYENLNEKNLTFLISRKQFEILPTSKPWAINLQMRDAAIKSFTDYFRMVNPPKNGESELSLSELQVKELNCPEGIFVRYDLKTNNIFWDTKTPNRNGPDELVIPRLTSTTSPENSKAFIEE